MASFATFVDIERAWRPLTEAESAVAETLVDYASAMLRARFSDIDDRIAAGTLDETLARLAVGQMVQRVLEHPNSAVAQESTGPFSVTYRREVVSRLAITDAEVDLVGGSVRRRVRNIELRAGLA